MTTDQQIVETERQILRVICQGCSDGPLDVPARRSLENYPWVGPDHQAIFKALLGLSPAPSATVVEQLPARLTRLGFPDVDWEDLFHPHGLTRVEAAALIDQLLDSGGG